MLTHAPALVFADHGVYETEEEPLVEILREQLGIPFYFNGPFGQPIRKGKDDTLSTPGPTSLRRSVHGRRTKHLSENYDQNLKPLLAQSSAFYALSELFAFSTASSNQILNLIELELKKNVREFCATHRFEETVSNIIYYRPMLDCQTECLRNTLHDLEEFQQFPTARNELDDVETDVMAVHYRLVEDYKHLVNRAESLTRKWESLLSMATSRSQLEESKQMLVQTRRIESLTQLAFIFIPLSFTSAFFGMNFKELNGPSSPPLWSWFVISLVVFLTSVLLLFKDRYHAVFRSMTHLWTFGERRKQTYKVNV